MHISKNKKLIQFCQNNLNYSCIHFLKYLRDSYRFYFDSYPYRRVNVKRNMIFIHIPKTAGTSVLTSLGGWAGDHCTYREFLQASPTKFHKYYKFCFVRNPYDRLVSTYEYLKQGGNKGSDLRICDLILSDYPTFEDFVLGFLNKETIYRVNLLKPQYWFIYDEHNDLQVDYIARFESIEKEYMHIIKRLNLKRKCLPQKNKSRRESDYSSYYNDQLKKVVFDLYQLDFNLLNYSP